MTYINKDIIQYKESIKDFINRNPQIPIVQRQFNDERIIQLYTKLDKESDPDSEYVVPYLGYIHCAMFKNRLYIVDGQHRYMAFKKYYEEKKRDFDIHFIVKMCYNEDEIRKFFQGLNDNHDPAGLILTDKDLDVACNIKNHIKGKYKKHISSSKNPRLSNINIDQVCKYFIKLCPDITDPIEIINKFEDINNSLIKEYEYEKNEIAQEDKIKKIIEDSNDKQRLMMSLLFMSDIDKKKRESVPSTLRKKLWDTQIGLANAIGSCYVCNNEIHITNFHAGHIVSIKNGGDTKLPNLKAICKDCNLSMSSKNLEDFKMMYF